MKTSTTVAGSLVVAVFALANASPAQAGGPVSTMAALEERLKPGTEVDVVDRAGRLVRGSFVRADREGVLVTTYGEAEGRRVAAGDVMTVTRAGDSLKNGALIGAAAGAISVLAIAVDDGSGQEDPWCTDTDCKAGLSVFVMAAYPAIGMWIDHAIKGRTVVYRAPTDRVTWSVTPHPVPRGAGVRVALKF